MNNEIVLVTGGARSGKSNFAYNLADSMSPEKVYIATAEPLDEEMKDRIRKHQEERGKDWDTIEEPVDLAGTLDRIKGRYGTVLIDCVTLWISNLLHLYENDEKRVMDDIERLTGICSEIDYNLIIVSNEVGMGIVPENRLARLFRDISGNANQMVGGIAGSVYLTVAGLPLKIK